MSGKRRRREEKEKEQEQGENQKIQNRFFFRRWWMTQKIHHRRIFSSIEMMKGMLNAVMSILLLMNTSESLKFNNKYCRMKNRICNFALYDTSNTTPEHSSHFDPMENKELQLYLANNQYNQGYQLIKRNPLVHISLDDVQILLNNLEDLDDETFADKTEITTFLYKRFSRQKTLKGFGCIDGEYPEVLGDISPAKLEEVSGLPISSLTPKERTTYWRLAGIFLCLSEYALGERLGIDPLYTLIPATFALFISDQFFLKGAVFESFYQKLIPEYRKKIIYHEAGHFLLAYLLGVPVRDCITNAWEARKNSDIKGQAGTIFYDTKIAEELSKQQISRSSINRLSVIIMAGIGAEANEFGRTEGGIADEQSLISFLSGVQPPWNILRIQGQARWAALQAILIIREHRASYDALVQCLTEGKGIGDCIAAIEENLPAVLPSVERRLTREARKKEVEMEKYTKYIEIMTNKVGGISEDSIPANNVAQPIENDVVNTDLVVTEFAKKIRSLEQAVLKGDLNVPSNRGGGIWLNDLRSAKNPSVEAFSSANIIQPPVETTATKADLVALEALKLHRGYRLKQLELEEQAYLSKEAEIDERLRALQAAGHVNSTVAISVNKIPPSTNIHV